MNSPLPPLLQGFRSLLTLGEKGRPQFWNATEAKDATGFKCTCRKGAVFAEFF